MAENLDYKIDSSWALNGSVDNEVKFGRLYLWAQSVGLPDKCNDSIESVSPCAITNVQKFVKGICPDGWHIPNMGEVLVLDSVAPGTSVRYGGGLYNVTGGDKLRELVQWSRETRFYGPDTYGFHAIPSSEKFAKGEVGTPQIGAFRIWTTENMKEYLPSGQYTQKTAGTFFMNPVYYNASYEYLKRNAVSVRCVKNY